MPEPRRVVQPPGMLVASIGHESGSLRMTSDITAPPVVAVTDRDAAFAAYVAARQRSLLRTAVLLTGDQHAAEDLVQSALARLYLSWDRVRRQDALDAYVRRIMVNQHTSWWRRAWRHHEVTVDEVRDVPAQRTETPDELAERDAVWQVVRRLPPRQRAAVVLRYYEDLSEAETAEVLGCSIGTVKSQTSRAVATLRAVMTEERRGT